MEGQVIKSLALTRDTQEILQRVSDETSDYIGRKVSGAAMIRAVNTARGATEVRMGYCAALPAWEEVLASGVMWDKKK